MGQSARYIQSFLSPIYTVETFGRIIKITSPGLKQLGVQILTMSLVGYVRVKLQNPLSLCSLIYKLQIMLIKWYSTIKVLTAMPAT